MEPGSLAGVPLSAFSITSLCVPQLYLAFRSHLDACCIHLHACSHSASTVHFADGYGRHNYTQQEAEAEVMQWATLKLPLDVFGLDVSAP